MRIINFFQSRLNILIYSCVAALISFLFFISTRAGVAESAGGHGTLAYYFAITSHSFRYLAEGLAGLGALAIMAFVSASLIRNFMNVASGRKEPPLMIGSATVVGSLKNGVRRVGAFLIELMPAIIFVVVMSFLLDGMNAVDRTRLMDIGLLSFEHGIFGIYGFAYFGSLAYPLWLIKFIIFSFENVSGILFAAAFLIGIFKSPLLREYVAAFCLAMLLAVPLWFAFPAMSPQDRFIDDVYRLPITPQIEAAVAAYHPDAPISAFLTSIRTGKGGLADMPTSTMPSAHTAWAVLAGYYLFRARKWLGWVALPLLIASTMGTVILAQHYMTDVAIGLVISALSIWLVSVVAQMDAKSKTSRV